MRVKEEGKIRDWMRRINPTLYDEMTLELERALLDPGGTRVRIGRIYEGLALGYPRIIWVDEEGSVKAQGAEMSHQVCTWCVDEELEEAHLCPKCWGSGKIPLTPVDIQTLFLFDPLKRASDAR
jgi:hypothetical protein